MSILQLLLQAFPEAVSGETMARELSVSRSAIWKKIQSLQRAGVQVSGKQNSGYRLECWPDLLLPELLEHYRRAVCLGKEVHYRETVDSTNLIAKDLARAGAPHGTLVVAEAQTAGRGRRGRSWLSEPGSGIFATVLLRPNLPPERVPLLTLAVGIAVVQTLQQRGLAEAWLKWPNDVWVGERKMVGILAEMSGQVDQVDWVVVGIGINTHQTDFPAELASRATSFLRETGRSVQRAELLGEVLARLEGLLPWLEQPTIEHLLAQFRSFDRLTGREVQVIATNETFSGQVLGISESGALIISREDGRVQSLLAGDVSLRI